MKKILLLTICIPLLFNSCKKEEEIVDINNLDWRLSKCEKRIDYGYFEEINLDCTYSGKVITNNETDITNPSDTNNGYYDATSTFTGSSSHYPYRWWESFHMNDGGTYANFCEYEKIGNKIHISNFDFQFHDLSNFFPIGWNIQFYTINYFDENELILIGNSIQENGSNPFPQNIIQEDSVYYFKEITNILTLESH